MKLNGPITPAVIEDTGRKLDLDVARLKMDMSSREGEAIPAQNQQLAGAIGVQSTPSFVIGDKLISGALDLAPFDELIAKSRNRKDGAGS
jgi:protein-disulfide isomerase